MKTSFSSTKRNTHAFIFNLRKLNSCLFADDSSRHYRYDRHQIEGERKKANVKDHKRERISTKRYNRKKKINL